jgi:hypothetical protein
LRSDSPAKNFSAINAKAQHHGSRTHEPRRETAMRRLLVADDDPHIGQAIRSLLRASRHPRAVRRWRRDLRRAVIDASTSIQKNIQPRAEPPRIIPICRRRPNHRASGHDAVSSSGAASVNQGRLPGVAGRRYTPQLE